MADHKTNIIRQLEVLEILVTLAASLNKYSSYELLKWPLAVHYPQICGTCYVRNSNNIIHGINVDLLT